MKRFDFRVIIVLVVFVVVLLFVPAAFAGEKKDYTLIPTPQEGLGITGLIILEKNVPPGDITKIEADLEERGKIFFFPAESGEENFFSLTRSLKGGKIYEINTRLKDLKTMRVDLTGEDGKKWKLFWRDPEYPVMDTSFLALLATSNLMTILDMESTFHLLGQGDEFREGNPILKPFVHSRLQAYAMQAGINTGITYLAYRLKKNGSKFWWLPLVGCSVIHGSLAGNNIRLVYNHGF